jgi:hypothetical protein
MQPNPNLAKWGIGNHFIRPVCRDDLVGTIPPGKKFSNVNLTFLAVLLAPVEGEHDHVADLIHKFNPTVGVGMVLLENLGLQKIILGLHNISVNL